MASRSTDSRRPKTVAVSSGGKARRERNRRLVMDAYEHVLMPLDAKRVDGDYVIAHVHVIIQPGEPGNAVVDIFRIQDGLVAEHWDVAQQVPRHAQNHNGMF